MVRLFSSPTDFYKDEDGVGYSETVHVFTYEDPDIDDFPLLSHNEKLEACGFKKENSTPARSGNVFRYTIDDSSNSYVIITETVMTI